MIDFHSHVLPQIDDGAQSVEESVEMLLSLKQQGVTDVVATPHYKGQCSVGEFLEQRKKSYELLCEYAASVNVELPRLLLGAEVALETYTTLEKSICELCIEGTKIILIEMPFSLWNVYMLKALKDITDNYGLQIVIAHIDRYYSFFNKKQRERIFSLADDNYVLQFNTSSLAVRSSRKLLKKLTAKNAKLVFGSDCHNMVNRRPVFDKCSEIVKDKCDMFLADGRLKRV